MSGRPWAVYRLKDPFTEVVRYVGMTRCRPESRLRGHITEAIGSLPPGITIRMLWIRDLVLRGRYPIMEVLERGHDSLIAGEEAEAWWIDFHLKAGCSLLNRRWHAASSNGPRLAAYEAVLPPVFDRLPRPKIPLKPLEAQP